MNETAAQSLSQSLWARNADRAAEALGHPFVRRIADGTLPRESFADFVAQDAFFLEAFCRAYGFGLAHSPDRMALDTFAELLIGVREELQLHASYAAEWGIRPVDGPAGAGDTRLHRFPADGRGPRRHRRHLRRVDTLHAALRAPRAVAVGPDQRHLCPVWVATYADDAAEVRTAYGRAMQLELAFFDAACHRT